PLSKLEYAAGVRDRTHTALYRARAQRRVGCGWVGVQRLVQPAVRNPHGFTFGACECAPDQPLLDARTILKAGTIGGAKLLGRNDIGRLQAGYCADFIAFRLDRIELLATEDPLAAVALCALTRVDHSWVHGRRIIESGKLLGADERGL